MCVYVVCMYVRVSSLSCSLTWYCYSCYCCSLIILASFIKDLDSSHMHSAINFHTLQERFAGSIIQIKNQMQTEYLRRN